MNLFLQANSSSLLLRLAALGILLMTGTGVSAQGSRVGYFYIGTAGVTANSGGSVRCNSISFMWELSHGQKIGLYRSADNSIQLIDMATNVSYQVTGDTTCEFADIMVPLDQYPLPSNYVQKETWVGVTNGSCYFESRSKMLIFQLNYPTFFVKEYVSTVNPTDPPLYVFGTTQFLLQGGNLKGPPCPPNQPELCSILIAEMSGVIGSTTGSDGYVTNCPASAS